MIILAFLAFASQTVAFAVKGGWVHGISAVAFAVAWGVMAVHKGSPEVTRVVEETTPDYGKGCRCDWLGEDTPEHTPSALCVSLRPNADRDLS